MPVVLKRTWKQAAFGIALAVAPFAFIGCHSAYVEADITNATATPITLVELDYPSASFGTGNLAAGAKYHYRFKILGSGPTKILWTDASRHDHTVAGPQLSEGQEGTLVVTITTAATAAWDTHLRP